MAGQQSEEGEDKRDNKASKNRISSVKWTTFLFQK